MFKINLPDHVQYAQAQGLSKNLINTIKTSSDVVFFEFCPDIFQSSNFTIQSR